MLKQTQEKKQVVITHTTDEPHNGVTTKAAQFIDSLSETKLTDEAKRMSSEVNALVKQSPSVYH